MAREVCACSCSISVHTLVIVLSHVDINFVSQTMLFKGDSQTSSLCFHMLM